MINPTTVTYHPYIPTVEDGNCSTCRFSLQEEGSVVAHNDLHPIHTECLRTWIKIDSRCPECRADVDPTNLLTCKEKTIIQIKKNNC